LVRRDKQGRLLYSPSDLTTYLASPFATWMDRLRIERPGSVERDEESADLKLVAGEGDRHERATLDAMKKAGRDVAEIDKDAPDALSATRAALSDGREIVFQAALAHPPFMGYADFLERVPIPSNLGAFSYAIVDTKLARSPKAYFLVQLCAYAEMLEALQGLRPNEVHVILGTGERRTFRTDDYFFAYLAAKKGFLDLMESFDPDRPIAPDPSDDHGRYASHAERWAKERDHLSQVALATASQIRKLEAAGITTRAALASTKKRRVPNLEDAIFERLKAQARLQIEADSLPDGAPPPFEITPPPRDRPRSGLACLPPESEGDVFADFEGYPLVDGGLEYLFGLVVEKDGAPEFHEWWAHDRAEEKLAFEGFVDFLTDRRARCPDMRVYHYAPYEVAAIKRLSGRHGTREEALDDLLRGDVFVDLYRVVRQALRVGAPNLSIKTIERLFRQKREGAVATAGDSVVAYHAFLESGEPRDWRRSERLKAIRAYNIDDCVSTLDLAKWLRERAREQGISWIPPGEGEAVEAPPPPKDPNAPPTGRERRAALVVELRAASDAAAAANDAGSIEEARLLGLLADLCEFHRREEKPFWWSVFERAEMSADQLVDEPDCIGGARRTDRPPFAIKKSQGFEYAFDASQQTKLDAGTRVRFIPDVGCSAEIESLDRDAGRLVLKIGPKALALLEGGEPPKETSLMPGDLVKAGVIEDAIERVARARLEGGALPPSLDDLLRRRPPRLVDPRKEDATSLVRGGEATVDAAVRIAASLEGSALCIQGPPGSGKTYSGARMILDLVARGRRVGIVANSHAAVLNLMKEVAKQADARAPAMLKVGGDEDAARAEVPSAAFAADSSAGEDRMGSASIVGGSAWFFSRPGVADAFDHLFVDEAGQMSLANLVGVSGAARNLVLMGDQMQLGQPIQGSHPGESGKSALDYVLGERATIPDHFGLFLSETRRLHPDVCDYVSGVSYEGRLRARPENRNRVVVPPANARRVPFEAGLHFIPVEHEGNARASDEEAEVVRELFEELLGRRKTKVDGTDDGVVELSDILVVAPYNLHVRKLRDRLPAGARVGSVDLFQGQEAAIVVVSTGASDAAESPRGLEFLFDRRRLNVAISRARSLALLVSSPALLRARAATVAQLALLNGFARAALGRMDG
jgi:predicted RecB family nuclease